MEENRNKIKNSGEKQMARGWWRQKPGELNHKQNKIKEEIVDLSRGLNGNLQNQKCTYLMYKKIPIQLQWEQQPVVFKKR